MQLGKFLITRPRKGVPQEVLATVDEEYTKGLKAGKKLILCVLAGRSGTRLLGDIFDAHDNATGITERYFEAESMYRYIKYNNLPIDTAGILTLIKHGIVEDWKKADIAFVNSPFFSHGVVELYEKLQPSRIIFAINEPEFTVQSMYNKGFFEHYYMRSDPTLANGFQPNFPQQWYWLYTFARLVPNGEFYNTWINLTRVGKVSWFGNKMNMDIWKQLEQIPKDKVFVFILKQAKENYYEYYKHIAKEFGLAPLLSEKQISTLEKKGVKKWHNKERVWSEKERTEFELYTKEWHELYQRLLMEKHS